QASGYPPQGHPQPHLQSNQLPPQVAWPTPGGEAPPVMTEEAHWLLRGVSPQQYRTFHDNPEMLELIAKNAENERKRAASPPTEKPWWWVALSVLIGVMLSLLCGAMGYLQLGELPHEAVFACGLIGGTASFYGVSGWRAGNYENISTGEKKVLWTKMGTGLRLLVTLGALLMLGLGLTGGWWAGPF
ncbi:MAG: hypothetical protein KC731_31995, partial [Myxococcales bacterium]|nr:hypothetical protein [Myxococcales bacterium]